MRVLLIISMSKFQKIEKFLLIFPPNTIASRIYFNSLLLNISIFFHAVKKKFVATSDNYRAVSLRWPSRYLKKNGIKISNSCNASGDRRALFRLPSLRLSAFFFSTRRESSIKVDIACVVSMRLYIPHQYWPSAEMHIHCYITYDIYLYARARALYKQSCNTGCAFCKRTGYMNFSCIGNIRLGLRLRLLFYPIGNLSVMLNNLHSTAPKCLKTSA